MRISRKLVLRVLSLTIGTAAAWLTAEFAAAGYLVLTRGSASLEGLSPVNAFVASAVPDPSRCSYAETLFPHPYLAFVHHGNPPCGTAAVNNVGLYGPDFPDTRPDDRFVILLAGGSVASQFGPQRGAGPSALERVLNARFISPTGRPFAVLNGANGAWKQPQQAIMMLLYGGVVHGFVTVEGFNEGLQSDSTSRLEMPAGSFSDLNPLASNSFDLTVARWTLGRLSARVRANSYLRHSRVLALMFAAASRVVESRAASRPEARTSVGSIFATPPQWTTGEHRSRIAAEYARYFRVMHAQAGAMSLKDAYFIQPVPALSKTLTDEELRVVGDLSYGPRFRELVEGLKVLDGEGVPLVSLLDLFSKEKRTIYADWIHFIRRSDGSGEGNEIMAERIADELARLWQLTPKAGPAGPRRVSARPS